MATARAQGTGGRKGLSYSAAGVSIARGENFARAIQGWLDSTHRKRVIPNPGGFAGLYRARGLGSANPVIVSSTDGVGTKLKVAFLQGWHDTVGIDLVAMCVNDILAVGAEPLFLLDYIGTSKLESRVLRQVVKGVAAGCAEAGCALLGGETAELPGFYKKGEYDLAGFAVGVVEESKILGKEKVRAGDVLLGLPSSGIHSNGLSLARKVLLGGGVRSLKRKVPGGEETVGEALLTPTRIYARSVGALLRDKRLGPLVHGASHITGGGLMGNLPRVIPNSLRPQLRRGSWDVPPIFDLIRKRGGVGRAEMNRVFNMGIGFILIVAGDGADRIVRHLSRRGEACRVIGEIVKGTGGVRWS